MPQAIPTKNNTCAVIVTYHPDDGFPERLKRVEAEFPLVIVVDNGSQPMAVMMLRRLSKSTRINLIENSNNLGIAAALNQGVKVASREAFQWIVTLDQDTVPHTNFLTTLFDIYFKSGGGDVLVGSNFFDVHRRRKYVRCARTKNIFQERKTLITSGTLVSLSLFEEIGLFREDYFIDSVDHEFSLRARSYGYRMLISCCPLMDHSIGTAVKHANRLNQLLSFNHSPTRKYFITRNVIATVKAYFWREPVWSMRQGLRLVSDFTSILLFEREKRKKITAFMVGVAHGMTGKMGPIEKTWPDVAC